MSSRAPLAARPVLRGGPGGIEIGGRVERMSIEDGNEHVLIRATDLIWTIGATWYLNRWSKLQGSVIHEDLTTATRTSTWSQVLRFQLVF